MVNEAAAAGSTAIAGVAAFRPELDESSTVTDWSPAVLSATEKTCWPASAAVKV